jgi:hypothetical protein
MQYGASRGDGVSYTEVVKLFRVGPIAVSDDRAQDVTYKLEILRDVGAANPYRLFLWSKDRYFVRRRTEDADTAAENRKWENPYRVEVRRDVESTEEYHLFSWDKDKFVKQLRENPENWGEKLIQAKDNSLFWEEVRGASTEDVLSQLTNILLTNFPSLGGDMRNLPYREIVKTIDLKPISVEETDQYYKFRIEILRVEAGDTAFHALVYRRESYSLQPTFAIDGELAYDLADCWLWIEDEQNLLGKIEGDTVEEVIERAVAARDELEERLQLGKHSK